MKYTDIISIKNLPSVFDLQGEIGNNWTEFISNTPFEEILNTVALSVSKDPVVKQKSIWLTGTYGTGKSHASSVIKHLLCDPIEEVQEYIKDSISNTQLRYTLTNHRATKRYYPIVLKGGEGVKDVNTFAMAIEKAVKQALKRDEIIIHLQSDFESIVSYINTKSAINWENIIQNSTELKHYVRTKQQLVARLEDGDMTILGYVKDALAKDKIDLGTLSIPIDEWIMEVQKELREQQIADGLLILWDEFTDVVDAQITGLLLAIQDIADRCMHPDNDSYLFLITHPKYSNNISADEKKKIDDRFHVKQYQMNQVSTYAIMSKKMKVVQREAFDNLRAESLNVCEVIALKLIEGNAQAKNDLLNLFPIHPYTAFLCTFCATHIGSSERSVFTFMLDNQKFRDFFESEENCEKKLLMTADYLWNYYYEAFQKDPKKHSHIVDRYIKNIESVTLQGEEYVRVFKSILLMNALTNYATQHSGVTPSENNIKFLFYGVNLTTPLNEILAYIHDQRIVQRLPNGLYSIEGASFSSQELEDAARDLKHDYSSAVKILQYAEDAVLAINKSIDTKRREISIEHFSLDETSNINLLNSTLIRVFEKKPSYSIHVAAFYGLDQRQIDSTKLYLDDHSKLDEHQNKVFVLFKQPLELEFYNQYIETMANMTVALKHKMSSEVTSYKGHAVDIIVQWQRRMIAQHCMVFFRGEMVAISVAFVSDTINNSISPRIFSMGVELLKEIRRGSDQFWKKYSSATSTPVETALTYPTLDATEAKIGGQYLAAKSFFKIDNGSSYIVNQEFKYIESSLNEIHPLVSIQRKVDEIMKKMMRTNTTFNFADRLSELAAPPYGLYPNYPNMFALAFAMRTHCGELYGGTVNKPLTNQQVADLVVDTFKHWNGAGGKQSDSKLMVRFGSKEEKELTKQLTEVLQFHKRYGDILDFSTLKQTLIEKYSVEMTAPFWTLNYANDCTENVLESIRRINALISDTTSNQERIKSALEFVKMHKTDLVVYFKSISSFCSHYNQYLFSIDTVAVQEHELEEVKQYIASKMNREIGWWDESIVTDKVKDWRISKTAQPVTPPIVSDIPPTPYLSELAQTIPISKNEVLKKVGTISDIEMARDILVHLIENDLLDDETLLFIADLC